MLKRCTYLLLLVVLLPVSMLHAQTTTLQPTLDYMRTQQAADGTFAGFGAGSTADAVLALAMAGADPAAFNNGGSSALDGLAKAAPEAAKDGGTAAKFVLAAVAAGQNPRAVGGTDLVAAIEGSFDSATGRYGADVTAHALALLALHAVGATVDAAAITALEGLQLPDGGWSFDGTAATGSDTNTTALAIQALTAVAPASAARAKAIDYLRTQQNDDGGFPYSQASQFGNASDANSTALSLQAILATGEDMAGWTKGSAMPAARLEAFKNDNGAFRYQDTPPDDNQLATYQAVPALLGKTLIVSAGAAPTAPATTPGTLPNTGAENWNWLLLLGAGAALAMGATLRRRSA